MEDSSVAGQVEEGVLNAAGKEMMAFGGIEIRYPYKLYSFC